MSMISAQIDELREYASRADGTFPMLASALRDAADTIWQLRDDLQRANDENAKLRELVADTLMHPREYCEKHGIEYEGWDSVDAHIYARMRELGVEV